jgi:hypothetical protein
MAIRPDGEGNYLEREQITELTILCIIHTYATQHSVVTRLLQCEALKTDLWTRGNFDL